MSPEQRACPGCKRFVPLETTECPYCGIVFDKARETATTSASSSAGPEHPTSSPVERKPPLFSRGFLVVVAVLVLLGAAAVGYYYYGPCGLSRIDAFGGELERLAQEWDDANELASSTPRIALANPVGQLQNLRREAQQLEGPKCLLPARDSLAQAMDETIAGYLAFMQDESEYEVGRRMRAANASLGEFQAKLEAVRDCVPFCQ